MFTVTTNAGVKQASTLELAWAMAIYDDGEVTLTKPDDSTQTFSSYSEFTTYVEENK